MRRVRQLHVRMADHAVELARAGMSGSSDAEAHGDTEQSTPPSLRLSHAPGDRVRVPRYGLGIVESVDADGVVVVFGTDVRRTFLASFVRPAVAPTKTRAARKKLPTKTPLAA